MLATRIIPVLLKRGDALVKGERFNSWRSVGHVLQAAKVHAARGVDELLILDIAATPEGRGPDFDAIAELTRDCFCPVTVGGGVRSVEDVKLLLRAGADKVAINTLAMTDPWAIGDIVSRVGSQAVTVVLDVNESRELTSFCGTAKPAMEFEGVARWMQTLGAGEILLQSIDRDGTMQGYDIELIRSVSAAVSIPVIACGGCSGPEDMLRAIQAGASAVAAGGLFQFSDHTPRSCAEYLLKHGVEARIPA